MIHIRIDDERENSKRRFACGIGPELPKDDVYFFADEPQSDSSDCPGCNPAGPRELGSPLSELSGRPGSHGFERFKQIAETWGHE